MKLVAILFVNSIKMVFYIIATQKGNPYENGITHYKYNSDKSESGQVLTKEAFWEMVKDNWSTHKYFSYKYGEQPVECEWRLHADQPFLQSDPNGKMKDNLLELPDIFKNYF